MAKDDSEPGQTREIIAKLRAEVEQLMSLVEYLKIKGQKYLIAAEEARHTPNTDCTELMRLEEQSARDNEKLQALTFKVDELRAAIETALKRDDKLRGGKGNEMQNPINPDQHP